MSMRVDRTRWRMSELGRMRRACSAACRWAVIVCEIMGWLIASPANAHHSAAMFDQQKALTLQGTVKT